MPSRQSLKFSLIIARGTTPAVPNIASSDGVPEGITGVTRARQQDTDEQWQEQRKASDITEELGTWQRQTTRTQQKGTFL